MSAWPVRLYRLLLRASPAVHRRGYGAAMVATFEARLADRSARGGGRALWLAREYASVVATGLGERLAGHAADPSPTSRRETMTHLLRELRHAARRLLRTPTFTVAAFLTFTLALGAATTVFAVVKSVALDPLPYPASDRLVAFDHAGPGLDLERGLGTTQALYLQYRALPELDAAAIYQVQEATIAGRGDPVREQVVMATPDLLDVLQVEPRYGRWFDAAEATPGAPFLVVLSHGFWTERFGADPAAVGSTLILNGGAVEIIGVMPEGFAFPDPDVALWRPMQVDEAEPRVGGFNYQGIGRLAEGLTVEGLRTAMDGAIAVMPERYPGDIARTMVEELRLAALPVGLREREVGDVTTTLWVLLGTAGLVLLIACANLANLFLVRWDGRQRETAVRRALGAGRPAVALHFLVESLLLTLAGGLAALGLAWAGVRALTAFAPPGLPRLHEVGLEPAVMLAVLGGALLAGLAFGAAPALAGGGGVGERLREAGRGGTAGRTRMRARNLLMAGQVALALVLLAGSGLMLRTYRTLAAIDPGFQAPGVLTFRVGVPFGTYDSRDRAAAFMDGLRERLAALPGVTAAGGVTCPPFAGMCYGDPMGVEGSPWQGDGPIPPIVSYRRVTPGYFEAMGIQVRAGRGLEEADHRTRTGAAVASRELVRLYLDDREPLGVRVHSDAPEDFTWFHVAGVVDDVPTFSLTEAAPTPALYLPLLHGDESGPSPHTMTFVVRADVPPLSLVPAVRRLVRELDPDVPVADVRTLQSIRDRAAASTTFTTLLLLLAAGTALVLGVVGVYAVVSYTVGRRAREMGIRMALGAAPGAVTGLVLRQGGRVVAAGAALGLLAAIQLTGFLEDLLYQVEARDPLTLTATTALIVVVGLAAVWLPARRAAASDPLDTLRAE